MKKIESQSFGKAYQSVCLYRQDIDEIVKLFEENTEGIRILDSEYVYESLDEIKMNKGDKPKELIIHSSSPYVSLEFKKGIPGIKLFRAEYDPKSMVLYHAIEQILLKRRKVLFRILSPTICIAFGILAYVIFILIPIDNLKKIVPQLIDRTPLMLLIISIPGLSLLGRYGSFYSLNLFNKNENGNFWYRQKDDLLKLLIGAIVGGVVTYIVTLMTK